METFFIGFLGGILLGELLNYNATILLILQITVVAIFVLLILFKKGYTGLFFALIFGGILALLYFQFFIQKPTPEYISHYNNKELTLEGRVENSPQSEEGKTKLIIRVTGIKGKILINVPEYPKYQYGDKLKIKGKLEEPAIFDDFNYRDYLKGQGIYSVINRPKIELLENPSGFSLKRELFKIKNRLEEVLRRILPEPEASLADGILFGNKGGMSDEFYQTFIIVGLVHLVALSGYNVTVISKNISFVSNLLFPALSFPIALFCIWLFVIMVGASVSIVRAALMGSLFLFANRVGRGRSMTRILLLTAFLMILQNPYILRYEKGFQLSFLATCGLVYFAPILEGFVRKLKVSATLKEAGISTLSAQIFVLPLLIFSFKKISLLSLPANLLVLPFIPATMFFIFLTSLGGVLFFPLGQVFGLIAYVFLKYIVYVAHYFSQLPGAYVDLKTPSIWWVLLYFLVLGAGLRWVKRKS